MKPKYHPRFDQKLLLATKPTGETVDIYIAYVDIMGRGTELPD
jgi:hypothetical protein